MLNAVVCVCFLLCIVLDEGSRIVSCYRPVCMCSGEHVRGEIACSLMVARGCVKKGGEGGGEGLIDHG